MNDQDSTIPTGSILDDIDTTPVAKRGVRPKRSFWDVPAPLRRHVRPILVGLAVAVVGGGIWAWLALRPRPVPDYMSDDLATVLDYTLLSGEFNDLALEERLILLRDLIDRLKNFSSSDNVALAMFATSIRDEMRAQLEESVKHLGVDLMDAYAADYQAVAPEDREDYIEDAMLNMTRLMEEIGGGQISGLPEDDDERIDAMKKQAERDRRMIEKMRPDRVGVDAVAPIAQFIRKDMDETSTLKQRARLTRFGRDMTRFLRGQDIATGEQIEPRPDLGGGD